MGKPAGKVAVITVGRIAMGLATAPTFDEIAGPALFLASDDGSFVTGIELTVDGGLAQA